MCNETYNIREKDTKNTEKLKRHYVNFIVTVNGNHIYLLDTVKFNLKLTITILQLF